MNSDGEFLWINQTKNLGTYGQSEFQSMLLDEESGNIYVSGYAMVQNNSFAPGNITIIGDNDTVVNNYDGEDSYFKQVTYILSCYDTDGNYKWYSCPLTYYCSIGDFATYQNKLYAAVRWCIQLTCEDITYYPSEQLQGAGTPYSGYSICEWDTQLA